MFSNLTLKDSKRKLNKNICIKILIFVALNYKMLSKMQKFKRIRTLLLAPFMNLFMNEIPHFLFIYIFEIFPSKLLTLLHDEDKL